MTPTPKQPQSKQSHPESFNILETDQIDEGLQSRGYIHVYTGNGKGKTTASLGLIIRALGRGFRVLLVMFTKGGDHYGELNTLKQLSPEFSKRLTIRQAGLDRIVFSHNQQDEDEAVIQAGWKLTQEAITSESYDLIVLDEANIALDLKIIDLNEMKQALKNKPEALEIVLTGRRAHPEIIEIAHLVSEIQPIKHYWDKGVRARIGIEY